MAAAPPQNTSAPPMDEETFFRTISSYDWDHDQQFQAGLRKLLASAPPEKADEVTLRAKWVFGKMKHKVDSDFDNFKQWTALQSQKKQIAERLEDVANAAEASAPSPASAPVTDRTKSDVPPAVAASDSSDPPPYPKSFNDIVELITSGKPIPGIKEIPNIVLDAPPSESALPARKKPWEK